MEKYFRFYVKIDLDVILYNINEVKKWIGYGVKIMVVIKVDGYGYGVIVLGDFFKNEVDYYGVVIIEEVMELCEYGIKVFILIFGYIFLS